MNARPLRGGIIPACDRKRRKPQGLPAKERAELHIHRARAGGHLHPELEIGASGGVQVDVDELFGQSELFESGDEVYMAVKKSECIFL